jgi:hypothetical protein
MKLFRDNTAMQAQKLIGDYVGKWMRVSGRVVNVSSIGNNIQVLMRPPISENRPDDYIDLQFAPGWKDRVSILRRDDEISAEGRLANVSGLWISFNDCELIEME